MKIIIQAVDSRMNWVTEHMLPRLDNAVVCKDEFEVYDSNNAYYTFIRALNMGGGDAVLLLEDDVIMNKDFMQAALKEIKKRPNDVIQFFSRKKDDLVIGSRYESGRTFMGNLCSYYPKGLSLEIAEYAIKWADTNKELMHGSPYDTMVANYLKDNKLKYWVVVPNLVEHKKQRSAIDSRRSSRRQSKTFVKHG